MVAALCSSAVPVAAGVRRPAPRAFQAVPSRPLVAGRQRSSTRRARGENATITRAQSKSLDFDAILADLADRFEKAENKPAIIGYTAATVGALFFSEWLIHLPGLNILLGFPIQLLGLAVLPYLGVKYLVDGESVADDVGAAAKKVASRLPGLDK